MRADGGMKVMEQAMESLAKRHKEHMKVYGEGNEARMTGAHETASFDKFTWGIANRGASVRINAQCAEEGKGYFEDRRPASNADPYQITGMIVETVSAGSSLPFSTRHALTISHSYAARSMAPMSTPRPRQPSPSTPRWSWASPSRRRAHVKLRSICERKELGLRHDTPPSLSASLPSLSLCLSAPHRDLTVCCTVGKAV